jgi:hypothetical protein
MEVKTLVEQLLFAFVRVETSDAQRNSSTGTAFIFDHPVGDQSAPFLVTNKHVVKNALDGTLSFTQGANNVPQIGTGYQLNVTDFESIWHGHPNDEIDVAITPFAPLRKAIRDQGVEIYFRAISEGRGN